MTDRLLGSVLPVRSTDEGNAAFGTAFVVSHDQARTYLVTCAHVVRDVGGDSQVLAGDQRAGVVAYGSPDGADDIAVLATDRIAATPMALGFDAERGRAVSVLGFRSVQLGARLLAVEPVDSTLGPQMALDSPSGRNTAWQLQFAERGLDQGYSGSPIVDVVTEEVVAIAAYRQDERRAIAIAVTGLRALWPDGLPDLAAPVTVAGTEFVYVPSSPFSMGTPQRDADELAELGKRESFRAEAPRHEVDLPGYYIGRLPVSNAQYAQFVSATGHRVPYRDDPWSRPYSWDQQTRAFPAEIADLPVVLVSWHDARAYCEWLEVRLPTEAEWEKAASGRTPHLWPWGDDWDEERCNTVEGGRDACLPVGALSPAGDSGYRVADLAGNVWEWCASQFDPYPYRVDDGREQPGAPGTRVIRGGAWGNDRWAARCAAREHAAPDEYGFSIGFRIALSRDAAAALADRTADQ
ncbi:MAG: SUMF1/EgtB/PvdO family nonheme iron enzyme [Sporichthyaceae bacterium]|nr:SUMF1/EgtB/PvdO family nonheme iron enzyme [Sporichthyaceae bacterium]